MIIDGRLMAEKILKRLKKRPKPKKILAAVLVGRNSSSLSFLKQKEKAARALGIQFKLFKLNSGIREARLKKIISQLNKNPKIGGIILQLPLPPKINRDAVIAAIAANKDVDALRSSELVMPPAAGAARAILKHIKFPLKSGKAVIVGRGLLVGNPIARWLKGRVKKIAVFYSTYFDPKILKSADLIVSGVGRASFIKGSQIKKGVVLIDFGYSSKRGLTRTSPLDAARGKRGKPRISGDFDFESCRRKAAVITPTPGGTGPILVAKLLENFFKLTKS